MILFALASCGALSREARYTGTVTPEGKCGEPSRATMTTEGHSFAFTPTDGVLLLRGEIAADGAARGQLATTGADRKPFVMTLDARVAGEHVEGRYITPRCNFTISLDRAHPGIF